MIKMSAQFGGGDADRVIFPLHKQFNNFFSSVSAERYLIGNTRFFIVLRVSGHIQDFNFEGPERLKYFKTKEAMTLDLSIPERAWKGKTTEDFRPYFARQLQECLKLLIAEAKKCALLTDFEGVRALLDKAILHISEKQTDSPPDSPERGSKTLPRG